MTPRLFLMEAIAVLCGAVIGLLVVNALHWLFIDGSSFVALTVAPGRIAMALVTVAVFAVLYRYLPQTPAALASFFAGVLIPTVIVLFSFDAALQTSTVVVLYAVFSVAALLTYRFVLANAAVRTLASEVAGRSDAEPPR